MVYLKRFDFPSGEAEENFFFGQTMTCYDSYYPFAVLPHGCGLERLDFEEITILCGGNGSGKSTALNAIAGKLAAARDARYNRTEFFETYLQMCAAEQNHAARPAEIRIITSDDVFDFILNLRAMNEGVDDGRDDLMEEYRRGKYAGFRFRSLKDYDQLKRVSAARRQTMSRYIRRFSPENVRERSNGESAFLYFTEKIRDDGLYLLDEPENSLSPQRQLALAEFVQNMARFFGCQIIMATHSPFLLSLHGAKIYNLDENPAAVRRWTELPCVRVYHDFFAGHGKDF